MLDYRFIFGETLRSYNWFPPQRICNTGFVKDIMLISFHLMHSIVSCFLHLVSLFVHLFVLRNRPRYWVSELTVCCISICVAVLITHFSVQSDRKHNNNYSCHTAGPGILREKEEEDDKKKKTDRWETQEDAQVMSHIQTAQYVFFQSTLRC